MTLTLSPLSSPKTRLARVLEGEKNGIYWRLINYPVGRLLQKLTIALDIVKPTKKMPWGYKSIRFLDVGAGIGNVLLAAAYLATIKETLILPEGIEHNPDLVEEGRKLAERLDHPFALLEGDAFNYQCYNQHDIIYYYQPIREKTLMNRLERKIEDEAKVGAIIIANYKRDTRFLTDKRFIVLQASFFSLGEKETGQELKKLLIEKKWTSGDVIIQKIAR